MPNVDQSEKPGQISHPGLMLLIDDLSEAVTAHRISGSDTGVEGALCTLPHARHGAVCAQRVVVVGQEPQPAPAPCQAGTHMLSNMLLEIILTPFAQKGIVSSILQMEKLSYSKIMSHRC